MRVYKFVKIFVAFCLVLIYAGFVRGCNAVGFGGMVGI